MELILFILILFFIKRVVPPKKSRGYSKGYYVIREESEMPKSYKNFKYKVRGRPDSIVKNSLGEIGILEFKKGHTIYPGHRKQIIATALSMKSKWAQLKFGIIRTSSGEVEFIDLNFSEDKLYKMISKDFKKIRAIKKEEYNYSRIYKRKKCFSCGHKFNCDVFSYLY